MILIYITNPTEEEAKKIAKILLEKHLIACANIFPITSIYRWKEEVKDDKEFVLIAKTKAGLFDRVRTEVESVHSYETPCIIRIDADANPAFAGWIDGQVAR